MVIRNSNEIACRLVLTNEALYVKIMNKYRTNKIFHESAQQTIDCFDKIYRKCLQGNVFENKILNPFVIVCLNM